MKTSDFYYELPQHLIAQTPVKDRSASRLLVYERRTRSIADRVFTDLVEYLNPGDLLVRNTTRVLPARLNAHREGTGGKLEILLLKRVEGDRWECLVKPGKRAKSGLRFVINDELSAVIGETTDAGGRIVRLEYEGIFEEVLDRAGEMPLPPYITEKLDDKERYQTVYARENGSAAAPTAGLHFTERFLDELTAKGVGIADVLLHVGLGTFRPVSVKNVEEHHMHSEYYVVPEAAADAINACRERGNKVICVGTTSCRTIESVADEQGRVRAGSGWTDIFIHPGYRFRAIDALITNFHLPESTLLMLVSAMSSTDEMLRVYRHAVERGYRFFSFGDAMLIL
ncbi:MAG: tRNA preQ1(34) S-adenosylmethionine ribosyltransferase-isomerase QueA [Bacillota bacterium]